MFDCVIHHRIYRELQSVVLSLVLLIACLNIPYWIDQHFDFEYKDFWHAFVFVIIVGIIDFFKQHSMYKHFSNQLAIKDGVIRKKDKEYQELKSGSIMAEKDLKEQLKRSSKQLSYSIKRQYPAGTRYRTLSFTPVNIVEISKPAKTFKDASTDCDLPSIVPSTHMLSDDLPSQDNVDLINHNESSPRNFTSLSSSTEVAVSASQSIQRSVNLSRCETFKSQTPSPRILSSNHSATTAALPQIDATPENCAQTTKFRQHNNVSSSSESTNNDNSGIKNENILPQRNGKQSCFSSSTPTMPRRGRLITRLQPNEKAPSPAAPYLPPTSAIAENHLASSVELMTESLVQLNLNTEIPCSIDINNNITVSSELSSPSLAEDNEQISLQPQPFENDVLSSNFSSSTPAMPPIHQSNETTISMPPPPPPQPPNLYSSSSTTYALSPASAIKLDRRFQSPAPSDIPISSKKSYETPYSQNHLEQIRIGIKLKKTSPQERHTPQNHGNNIYQSLSERANRVNATCVSDDDEKETDTSDEWGD